MLTNLKKKPQTSPCFYVSTVQIFGNTVGKGDFVLRRNFSFFQSVFYPFGEVTTSFMKFKIVVSNFFLFERSVLDSCVLPTALWGSAPKFKNTTLGTSLFVPIDFKLNLKKKKSMNINHFQPTALLY